jgi:hypothetical protein
MGRNDNALAMPRKHGRSHGKAVLIQPAEPSPITKKTHTTTRWDTNMRLQDLISLESIRQKFQIQFPLFIAALGGIAAMSLRGFFGFFVLAVIYGIAYHHQVKVTTK